MEINYKGTTTKTIPIGGQIGTVSNEEVTHLTFLSRHSLFFSKLCISQTIVDLQQQKEKRETQREIWLCQR